MLYTVKEVSSLSNVTIKTLHHYHKIGLLLPQQMSEAGYRLYGTAELERLQQILFYRELDFSLEQIKQLLDRDVERSGILSEQRILLKKKAGRLETIMETLEKSIRAMEVGDCMEKQELFTGFANEKEWEQALQVQKDYLRDTYQFDLDTDTMDVQEMNAQAKEAVSFMTDMASALVAGIKHTDERVSMLIDEHLAFLNQNGHPVTPQDFANQARFFLQDDFHLGMLESQQTGLAYFLTAAAEAFAER
ncbi:MerR family transcriptional regulator [Brevibacillus choshinensis]|uniref:MerR family transcriptional regulator n=1 Tax=Brevibacillus choshinensis TaxID=54911 RepID=UPI002E1FA8D4|nr:MerR family transcriptional regulator [Brevibacillus choshinensis]